jgi:hypothetical protein
MAVIATKTMYGIVFTCSGGTAVLANIIPKDTVLNVSGVHFAGANTADIVTIKDADGNLFAQGYGGTGLSNHNISFAEPVRINGVSVAAAGATTGVAILYCE